MTDDERLQAEQRARRLIDEQLTRAGWVVQDLKDQALGAAVGVAAFLHDVRQGAWIASALVGIAVSAVWNYALSSRFVWGRY